jgi:hypothetical protein
METIRKETIEEVHFWNRVWRNQIAFYFQELKIFQERLEHIAASNPSKEIHIPIEQFQNRFIIQRNELDKIEHLVNITEDQAVQSGKMHVRRIDYLSSEQFSEIKNSMQQYEKLFKEMREDFYNFISRWV